MNKLRHKWLSYDGNDLLLRFGDALDEELAVVVLLRRGIIAKIAAAPLPGFPN